MIDPIYLQLVTAIVGATLAFLTAHKITSKRSIENKLMMASAAVQAAEELFPIAASTAKRDYVMKALDALGISEAEAELLLHAAVTGLRANGLKS